MDNLFLNESKRIMEELSNQIQRTKRILYDKDFLNCLAEEIQESIKDTSLINPAAIFELMGNRDINFLGIKEKIEGNPTFINIPLINLKEQIINLKEQIKINEQQTVIDKAAKIAEETLDLDLKLKKKELIDKILKK